MYALYIATPKDVSPRSTVMPVKMSWHQRFRRCFVDLRFMTGLMCAWLCAIILVLMELEVFSRSKFMSFGPRADLKFMHVAIDTYYKYNILIAMIIMHTFITDIISDSLVPHVLNVIQDTKNKYIPHKAFTYYFITTAWSIYCSFTQLFGIFIAFAQLDLLLFRLGSDLLANAVTLTFYLDGKTYDPTMYSRKNEHNQHNNNNHDEEDDEHKLIEQSDCIEMIEVMHNNNTTTTSNEDENVIMMKNKKKLNNNNKRSTLLKEENEIKEDEEEKQHNRSTLTKSNNNLMNTFKDAMMPKQSNDNNGEEKEGLLEMGVSSASAIAKSTDDRLFAT